MKPVITHAGPAQAESVIKWLKHDVNEYGEHSGFFFNRDVIRQAARDGEFVCMRLGLRIIGFAVYGQASISLFEIRQAHRGRGHGRQLAEHLIAHLFKSGATSLWVKCSPRASQGFWENLGFVANPVTHPYDIVKMTMTLNAGER